MRQHFASQYPICKDALERCGLMHRLDVQTSGVLLCAKSYMGSSWIRMQWHCNEVMKEYICLVHGWVKPSVTEVFKPIHVDMKKAQDSQRMISMHCSVSDCGKPAYTEIATIAYLRRAATGTSMAGIRAGEEQYSLVALKLHTGRTHQIRVHMSAIGHPLVCDAKYGSSQFFADCKWCMLCHP